MTKVRIIVDIIMDDTSQNRAKIIAVWNKIKLEKDNFITLFNTQEKSKVSVHLCHHDETPPLPDVSVKEIILNTITKDDDF